MRKGIAILAVSVLLSGLLSGLVHFRAVHAAGNTYYISPTGRDTNPGTSAAPFATIDKAWSVAKAGDIINLKAGIYNQIAHLNTGNAGTSAAPITIQTDPASSVKAVIDGTGTGGVDLIQIGTHDLILQNLEVRNSTRTGIAVWNSQNITVRNNTVHDSLGAGIYAGYSTMHVTKNVTIEGNVVYHNVLSNANHNDYGGGWAAAVIAQRADNVTMKNNTIYENHGEGLILNLVDNGYAAFNTVHDNYSVELYFDNATNSTFERNFAYSTGKSTYYRFGRPAVGLQLANEAYGDSNPNNNLKAINNIFVNNGYGLLYGNYGMGGGMKNTLIANNTFYNNSMAGMISIESAAHSATIQNNIFQQAGTGTMVTIPNVSGLTFKNNNWYGGSAGAAAGPGDVNANPAMVSPGTLSPSGYQLTGSSPAINAGTAVSVTVDYFGNPRPSGSAYDIGAHEFGGTPTPDTQAPSAPTGLTVSGTTSTSVSLSWNPSTDNVGVAGYEVYNGSTKVNASLVANPSYTVTGLAASTSYTFTVKARDAADNVSAASNAVTATTNPASSGTLTEAENYNSKSASGVTVQSGAGSTGTGYVRYSAAGSYVQFNSVLVQGKSSVQARVGSSMSGQTLEVRAGSPTGTHLATVSIPNTGGSGTWQTVTATLSPSGIQYANLYFVFKGGSNASPAAEFDRFQVQ